MGERQQRLNKHQRRTIWITAILALLMFLHGDVRLAFVLVALGTLLVWLLAISAAEIQRTPIVTSLLGWLR